MYIYSQFYLMLFKNINVTDDCEDYDANIGSSWFENLRVPQVKSDIDPCTQRGRKD